MDANLVSKQTFGYDQYNNQTDVYEYDFGSASPPDSPTRHTHIDYLTTNPVNGVNYATDTNIHIRSLPLKQIVYAVDPSDGAETWVAQTKYEYDRYDATTNHAALVNRSNISGLDSSYTTGYTTRGNVTQPDRWLNSSGSSVIGTSAQYDIAGNVVKVIDSNGNATQFDYRDNFGSSNDPTVQSSENPANNAPGELGGQMSYAFPFKITNALEHKAYTKYDYYLGRPVLSEDPNGVKSNIYFNDALDRPTGAYAPSGPPSPARPFSFTTTAVLQ